MAQHVAMRIELEIEVAKRLMELVKHFQKTSKRMRRVRQNAADGEGVLRPIMRELFRAAAGVEIDAAEIITHCVSYFLQSLAQANSLNLTSFCLQKDLYKWENLP